MWNETKIEFITEKRLKEDCGNEKGKEIYSIYLSCRKVLVEEILSQIKAILPKMTDHGNEHIANVLENCYKLLLDEDKHPKLNILNSVELYFLIKAVLFHDVGNIHGRKGHNKNIAKIYEYSHAEGNRNVAERRMLFQAVEAHCGIEACDTLVALDLSSQLHGQMLQLRKIAAVVRFADELAEGPQRTSRFMQKIHKYNGRSKLHHQYASATDIFIDGGDGRIALTYDIDIKTDKKDSLNYKEEERIRELMNFIYKRIIKLNQERKYVSHYCEWLQKFKRVTVTFNFHIKGKIIQNKMPELNELVIPGAKPVELSNYSDKYKLDNVINSLKANLKGV